MSAFAFSFHVFLSFFLQVIYIYYIIFFVLFSICVFLCYIYFIALTADGKVYGWGYNGKGQLGLNNTTSYKEPTYLGIDNAIDVAAGGNYTIVLKQDGTLWATGNNENGELGINNTATQKTFVQLVDEQGTGKLRI